MIEESLQADGEISSQTSYTYNTEPLQIRHERWFSLMDGREDCIVVRCPHALCHEDHRCRVKIIRGAEALALDEVLRGRPNNPERPRAPEAQTEAEAEAAASASEEN